MGLKSVAKGHRLSNGAKFPVRILWTHNFDPTVENKGVFVHTAAEGIRALGADLTLEYLGNLRSVHRLLKARNHVRKLAQGFDIVHAQFGSACALATAATNKPKVLTIRGSDWKTYQSSIGFTYFHSRLASGMTRLALNSFDRVISVSNRVAAELTGVFTRARPDVLPSPVDLSRFVPQNKAAAKARLGFPDCTEKWVLFNSLNLDNPIKRFDLAKQAFDIANAKSGNLRLRLATDLPHGELPLFTAACDVILCTSENEGWPNSIKEALACDVPFVATDVSDLRDIAKVEDSCRVCPPEAQVIADNIGDVLTSGAPENLRRHVAQMSLSAVSDKLISIYQSVLSTRQDNGAVAAAPSV